MYFSGFELGTQFFFLFPRNTIYKVHNKVLVFRNKNTSFIIKEMTDTKVDYKKMRKSRKKLPPLVKYWVTNPVNGRRLRAHGKAHHRLIRDKKMPISGGRYIDDDGRVRLQKGRASSTYTFDVVLRLKRSGVICYNRGQEERRTTKTLTLCLKDGEELTEDKIRERIVCEQERLNQYYIREEIDFEYVETHGTNGTLVNLENVASLTNIACHGARWKYFHDVEESQDGIQSGTCAIDCIVARCRKILDHHNNIPQKFTSPAFYVKWFQDNIQIEGAFSRFRAWTKSDGLTMDELNLFIDSPEARGIISLYVISPDERIIHRNVKENSRMCLCLKINGEHVYLLNRKNLHLVNESHFIDFGFEWPSVSSINIGFELLENVSDARLLLENNKKEHSNGYVICGMKDNDRMVLTSSLHDETGCMLPIKFTDCGISELKLPDGRFIMFRSESKTDIEDNLNIQQSLVKSCRLPILGSLPTYPRSTQITRWYFYNLLGEFPRSVFNTELGDLFEKYKRGGMNTKIQSINENNIEIDQSKCYTNVLISNKHPWCVFDVLDQRDTFESKKHTNKDGTLVDGWYVVNREIRFPWLHTGFKDRLYPKSFVEYAIKHRLIRFCDISEAIIPNRVLPASFFRSTTENLFDKLGKDDAKTIINPFTGMLGKTRKTEYQGQFVNRSR